MRMNVVCSHHRHKSRPAVSTVANQLLIAYAGQDMNDYQKVLCVQNVTKDTCGRTIQLVIVKLVV